MVALPITGSVEADTLLETNPLALLIGMLLDQQVTMELAFKGPHTLDVRLHGLDAATVASMPLDKFIEVCAEPPAIHRYPKMMGTRVHELCQAVVSEYGGHADRVWTEATNGKDLRARLLALPGFGEQKAKIFIALLAKRFGVQPEGWEQAAKPYSDEHPRSVADVTGAESLEAVREWKKSMKASKR